MTSAHSLFSLSLSLSLPSPRHSRQATDQERETWRADKAKVDFERRQAEMRAENAVEELERANVQIAQLQAALATAQAAGGGASDAEMQVCMCEVGER